MNGHMTEPTLPADDVPKSGRQRRKLAKRVGDRKCRCCREKALIVRTSGIACAYCGRTQ